MSSLARYVNSQVPVSSLAAGGTASSTTVLRGDGVWAAPTDPRDPGATGDAVQRIGWPAYVYPTLPSTGADNYWDRALKHAPVVDILVVNIGASGGPGTSVNSDYTTAIRKAQASGVTVIGYVNTRDTTIPLSPVIISQATVFAEITAWLTMYPTIEGIFFDQVSIDSGDVAHYQALYNYAKNALPPSTRQLVVMNPGVPTIEAYMACADIICNAEGDPTIYRARTAAAWERNYPAHRFWHIVHSIASVTELQEMQDLSRTYRAGYVYFTDDPLSPSPFDTLPADPFWSRQVARVSRGGGEYPVDLAGAVTIGGDNGLSSVRLRGRKTTTGAPSTGTWVAGDLVIDSTKVWWLCTVSGTPGTWV